MTARAALVLAGAALVVAVAAWVRGGGEPCADTAAVTALRAQVAALEARLDARAVASGGMPSNGMPSGGMPSHGISSVPSVPSVPSAADMPPPAAEPAAAGATPPGDAIVEVRSPHPAIAVTTGPGDALAVTNHDAALTGRVMHVELRTASGAVVVRPITVPPPGS